MLDIIILKRWKIRNNTRIKENLYTPFYSLLGIIHLLLLIRILLLIYKLKYSQLESCLISLNARIIHINFPQIEILMIE